ncbi:hypothetical protein FLJC2902T_26000 [Flavobacterium limnosediminis JC2902]|uniref:Phosphatase n=1 Tax=Flavobacterium limnosediminis JC2902 TaxID=1341181 RepID=V6SJ56_9FLAO|nr:hypothetical protein [Flavobacterium limnosediminis]ESU26626.1 hypothetical protein FLJC2902T_26000 [Flavobacterium limnosediminis JC2902]
MKITTVLLGAAFIGSLTACNSDEGSNKSEPANPVLLKNHSVTPVLMNARSEFSSIQLYSLFSSEDDFMETPDFVFGGSADGSGLFKNTDGTFSFLVNNEDNYAVSKIKFDNTFKPVAGEYVLNSTGAGNRLCSASLATPEIHGFGPLFLTAGESDNESQVHGITPYDTKANNSTPRPISGFGRWCAENAVPLAKEAFTNQTIVLLGDDDSGAYGGQLVMYKSSTGDLNNGKVYVIKRTDNVTNERTMSENTSYPIQFVEIPNAKTNTGLQNNQASQTLNAIAFGRVEDIDYRKETGKEREIYFNVTGQNNTGANADNSRSKYGRVYKLELDANNPLSGRLTLVLDGDNRSGKAKLFQNPDNICVTKNFVYIQEDSNGYGDETHDAYIYQYNITTKELKVVFELDHKRNDVSNKFLSATSAFGSWEYGALIDVSETIGIPDTFMLSIQPHSWRTDNFKGVDGGTVRPNENQGSQIVLIKGLPR